VKLDDETIARAAGWKPMSDGAQLLAEVERFVQRFVVMSPAQAAAVALWVVHTHLFEVFVVSPYLGVTSAEKRSGKTRLLRVLELLCARPWRVIMPTEAVVYRKIARDSPTLLLDEVDAIFGRGREHEPLRALLNAGNEPGAKVPRCAGPQRDRLEEFEIFCPKALAGIGNLPDTVADRTVAIRLKRRSGGERAERFRPRLVKPEAEALKERIAAWCDGNTDALRIAEPEVPEELDDRIADSWEPLLAIADLVGGPWPQRSRSAALALSGSDGRDDASRGVQLLADIRRLFAHAGGDRVTTRALIEGLAREEESPWAAWWDSRSGEPEKGAARKLASLLRPFEIRSRSIKLADRGSAKGFKLEWFQDSFERYLPRLEDEASASPVTSGTSAHGSRSDGFADPSPGAGSDGSQIPANPRSYAGVTEVTDSNAANGFDPREQDFLEDVQALLEAGEATLRDATPDDLNRDWIELGPGVWVDAACYPAPCPHRSHRETDWVTPDRQLACGVCNPPQRPEPEVLPGVEW
jgi:hypothetical protein